MNLTTICAKLASSDDRKIKWTGELPEKVESISRERLDFGSGSLSNTISIKLVNSIDYATLSQLMRNEWEIKEVKEKELNEGGETPVYYSICSTSETQTWLEIRNNEFEIDIRGIDSYRVESAKRGAKLIEEYLAVLEKD